MNREEKNEGGVAVPQEVKDGGSHTGSQARISRASVIHIVRRRPWLVVIVVLLAISAVALTLLLRPGSSGQAGRPVPAPTGVPVPAPSGETAGGTQPNPGDITITLAPEELENAHIKTEVATTQAAASVATGGQARTTGTAPQSWWKRPLRESCHRWPSSHNRYRAVERI